MAISNVGINDFENAIIVIENIISQFSKSYVGYWLKGYIFHLQNNTKDVITNYNIALSYTPERSFERCLVLRSRSGFYLSEGNWNKVLSDAEDALECDAPDDFHNSIKINKSLALEKLGYKEEAKEIIEQILPDIYLDYYLAAAFAFLKNKEKMLEELKKAITRDSLVRLIAKVDSKFSGYRDDPDFKKIISEK